MKLIFLGPPGAGKGTQAERVCKKYSLAHISTGEILRSELRAKSELGQQAQSFIDKGALVPDTLIVEIVKHRLHQSDCLEGFLLDGFPRTLPQADALKEIVSLDAVINIDVPLDKLASRITGRRMCAQCGSTYHVSSLCAPDASCKCGHELYQRDDDKLETVMNRLKVYEAQTKPLIEYYEKAGLLIDIDGDRDIEIVFADICTALSRLPK